jgi:HlyD family secretion protein
MRAFILCLTIFLAWSEWLSKAHDSLIGVREISFKDKTLLNNTLKQDLESLKIDRQQRWGTPATSHTKRFGLLIAVTLLLIVGGGYFILTTNAKLKAVEVVRVFRATTSAGEAILAASGHVSARAKVEVGSSASGVVEFILDQGEFVEKGQIIARLDDSELQAQMLQAKASLSAVQIKLNELEAGSRQQEIAQAKAGVTQVEARLKNAKMSLQRTRELYKAGLVSRQALDEAQTQSDVVQAEHTAAAEQYELVHLGPRIEQIEQARSQVQLAQANVQYYATLLDKKVVRAPINGIVLERFVNRGEMVSIGFAGQDFGSAALLTIADPKDLQVELDISEKDISKVALHQPASIILDAYPGQMYRGELVEFSPKANREKGTIQIKVKVGDPDSRWRPEMTAQVNFLQPQQPQHEGSAILIPKAALVSRGEDSFVYLVKDSRISVQAVKAARIVDNTVEIVRGLEDGDTVIVSGQDHLTDGEQVVVKD